MSVGKKLQSLSDEHLEAIVCELQSYRMAESMGL